MSRTDKKEDKKREAAALRDQRDCENEKRRMEFINKKKAEQQAIRFEENKKKKAE